MSAALQNWVSAKTAKGIETTLDALNKVAVKYNNFSGAHHEFIQVTSLGGDKVYICKTKTPEIRATRHTTQPKAIWTLLRHMYPVVAPAPTEVEVEQALQYLVNAVDALVIEQANQAPELVVVAAPVIAAPVVVVVPVIAQAAPVIVDVPVIAAPAIRVIVDMYDDSSDDEDTQSGAEEEDADWNEIVAYVPFVQAKAKAQAMEEDDEVIYVVPHIPGQVVDLI